jgi:hypothetical protein
MDQSNQGRKLQHLANYHSINSPRHFPESDETQKGHMKKQHQGVQSTSVLAETTDITNVPALPKMKNMYIKICNATKTMHSNQTSRFPATLSKKKIHNGVSQS